MPVHKDNTKNRPLDRKDWITLALKTLHDEGIDKVHIEPLAKKLNVTKGSFYWHFKNRDELLDGLLDYWENETTQMLIKIFEKYKGNPSERIRKVFKEIIGKERAKYDISMRVWARTELRVQKTLKRVDKTRLSYLHDLFIDLGFNRSEANIRSELFYYYMVGEWYVTGQESKNKRLADLEKKLYILTQPMISDNAKT